MRDPIENLHAGIAKLDEIPLAYTLDDGPAHLKTEPVRTPNRAERRAWRFARRLRSDGKRKQTPLSLQFWKTVDEIAGEV